MARTSLQKEADITIEGFPFPQPVLTHPPKYNNMYLMKELRLNYLPGR